MKPPINYYARGWSADVGGPRRSVSTQTIQRRLVCADSMRRRRPGQALLIYTHLPPSALCLRLWVPGRRTPGAAAGQPARRHARPARAAMARGEDVVTIGPATTAAKDMRRPI